MEEKEKAEMAISTINEFLKQFEKSPNDECVLELIFQLLMNYNIKELDEIISLSGQEKQTGN